VWEHSGRSDVGPISYHTSKGVRHGWHRTR
jgi:hypothetical protein